MIESVGCDINGSTVLESLLWSPDAHAIEYLLHFVDKIDVAAKVDERSRTPLHVVVSNLQATGVLGFKLVKALLAYGADPTAKDKLGVTPLHLTSAPTIIRLLCDLGADVFAVDRQKTSVLSFSSKEMPYIAYTTGSSVLVYEKRRAGIQAKVAEGGQELVRMRDKKGMTAAQLGAKHNSLNIFKACLGIATDASLPAEHPAEAFLKNDTLLHHAIYSDYLDDNDEAAQTSRADSLVSYLIASRKCLPIDVNDEGETALHYGSGFAGEQGETPRSMLFFSSSQAIYHCSSAC